MTYTDLDAIRALGITEEQADDDKVNATILLAQDLLDRACRQWFEPRTIQFFLDGSDSDALHFGVPIISIEWLRLSGTVDPLDASYYKVYNGRAYPDDRRNPRIKLLSRAGGGFDIYSAPVTWGGGGRAAFRKGRQNYEVRGSFGFVDDAVDEDDEPILITPRPIKDALERMVIERLANPAYVVAGAATVSVPSSAGGGVVVEEWTDGHKLKYASADLKATSAGLTGITRDPFVLDVIKLYRAPIGLATPATWSYGV